MPLACTLYIIPIKYSNEEMKLNSTDWTMAAWLVLSFVNVVISVIYFNMTGDFVLRTWISGFISSLLNLMGCVFAIACFSTGCPIGPASALMCTQTIVVVVISAIASR